MNERNDSKKHWRVFQVARLYHGIGKDSNAYKIMKKRYIELKVILNVFGINLNENDIIKE